MKKKEIYLNRILKPIVFLIVVLALEIFEFFVLNFKKTDGNTQLLPTYIFFNLGVWLIMAGIIFAPKQKWLANIFFYLFLGIQIVFDIVNIILIKSLGNVFYFAQLALASEGADAFDWSMVDWDKIAVVITFFIAAVITEIWLDLRLNKKFTLKKVSSAVLGLIVMASCMAIGVSTYAVQDALISPYDQEVCQGIYLKNYSMQQLGTYGFYLKDLRNTLFTPKSSMTKEETLNKIEETSKLENTDAILYDDNLIIIMLESLDKFAIDPYNTPTLYKLLGESVNFTSFTSNNKTNISETIGLLGYMPFAEELTYATKDSLSVQYALPNLFNSLGYQTNYFHSFRKNFYNRDKIIPTLGFDNAYFMEDADIPNKTTAFYDWNSEVDVFNAFKDKMAPTDGSKFMSFYLTVATHGKYSIQNPKFEKYYTQYDQNLANTDFKTWFASQGFIYPEDEETQTLLKNFKAAAMDTDAMVATLLEHLNTPLADGSKLIDNTTLVFYADHNCYYHDLCYTIKGTDVKEFNEVESYQVPMFIYSQKLEAKEIDTFTGTYDIYPTICELYGLPYSTFMTYGEALLDSQGNDISKEVYRIYFSQKTGYYSAEAYSTGLDNPIPVAGGGNLSTDFVTQHIDKLKHYFQKQKFLNDIYIHKW